MFFLFYKSIDLLPARPNSLADLAFNMCRFRFRDVPLVRGIFNAMKCRIFVRSFL
jgi:hypothetical protein